MHHTGLSGPTLRLPAPGKCNRMVSRVGTRFYTRFMGACPSCGTESPDAAKFCAECGARLTPAEAPERFRKTVTILFSDVVGSTALGERLDPETVRATMRRYFEDSRGILERRSAGPAEPEPVWIFLAAACASPHSS